MGKRILSRFLIVFKVIRWPSLQRQLQIGREVEAVCHLPGVIEFLDGTHIRLSYALKGDTDYYNRKGYPSVQLQVIISVAVFFFRLKICFCLLGKLKV